MRLDVAFTPAGLTKDEVAGRPVFVIDVLRATTVVCAALHHGARGVIPVSSIEEAMRLAQTLDSRDVLLAGERECLPIEGFALGNSPLEMTPAAVKSKTMILTTTNGTRAMLAAQGASQIYLAAAANLTQAGERARQILAETDDLLIICSGHDGAFGLDDAYTAGRLVVAALGGHRSRKGLNDAALVAVDLVRRYGERWERPFALSAAGRRLTGLGFSADVAEAARQDRYPVLPLFHDRRITAAYTNGGGLASSP
jgi:2-phosphosulfolactate phosphatase